LTDALEHLHEAAVFFSDADLPLDLAMALNGLGEAYAHGGDRERAAEHHRRAIETSERCGSAFERARACHRLGDLAADEGDARSATALWSEAREGYETLGAPQAVEVATRLVDADARDP
jgi:tetratricopeptide (TPR) repeat protein